MNPILEEIEITLARVETEAALKTAQERLLDLCTRYERRKLNEPAGASELAAYDVQRALNRLEDSCRAI